MPIRRLAVFFAVLCSVVFSIQMPAGSEPIKMDWQSRIIHLRPERGQSRAPVVTAVSLQPGGRLLATAGDDHLIRLWDTSTGQFVRRLDGHTDWVRSVAFSPDGTIVATAGNDRRVILWDASDGGKRSVLANHDEAITYVLFSPDGMLLAAAGFEDRLRVYDVPNERMRHELLCPCRDMRAIAFSPNGRLLAAGGRNGTVRLWNIQDGTLVRDILAHRQRIHELLFSNDGEDLISSGEDRVIRVSSVVGQENFVLASRPAKVLSMTLYAPGRLATAGTDNLIRLWDLAARREIGVLPGHSGSVAALACDGDTIVSGSFDTTIRVWKTEQDVADGPGQPAGRFGANPLKELE